MPKLIGITGYIGSGKTLAADYLCSSHNFIKLKMAQPIKDMLYAVGLTTDDLEGRRKEQSANMLCNQTPRYAMQTLGTEWGRDMMGPDLWVHLWERKATGLMSLNHNIVSDDIRYENEVHKVRNMGGVVVRIKREGSVSNHPSEEQDFEVDYEIPNNDGITTMFREMDYIIE